MSDLWDDFWYAMSLGQVGVEEFSEVLWGREKNREESRAMGRVPNAFGHDGEGGPSEATISAREERDPSDELYRQAVHDRTDCRLRKNNGDFRVVCDLYLERSLNKGRVVEHWWVGQC